MMKYFLTLISVIVLIVVFFFIKRVVPEKYEEFKEKKQVVISLFEGRIKGNGSIVVEKREVADFSKISVNKALEVELRKGDVPGVEVHTHSNLQKYIKTEVIGNELNIYIEDAMSVSKDNGTKVVVIFTELEAIESSLASNVFCKDEIKANEFRIKSHTASSIELEKLEAQNVFINTATASVLKIKGHCESLNVKSSTASTVDLSELEAIKGKAVGKTAAQISLNVSDELDMKAKTGAKITYEGNPKKTKKVTVEAKLASFIPFN